MLTSNNFASWYLYINTILVGLDLKGYLDDSTPRPESDTTGASATTLELSKWIQHDNIILHVIIASISETIVLWFRIVQPQKM